MLMELLVVLNIIQGDWAVRGASDWQKIDNTDALQVLMVKLVLLI